MLSIGDHVEYLDPSPFAGNNVNHCGNHFGKFLAVYMMI